MAQHRGEGGAEARVSGATRPATRGDGVVVEVAGGVTVYPAREAGDRWRAVWYEGGRRPQCESASESGLAARLVKVTERLTADAPGMEQPGAELIAHYLSPGRHPADRPSSRKHAGTQARLCRKYLAPAIAGLRCEDIKTSDMQAAVNTAPTPGEGTRLAWCISALVTAGISGGYLTSPRLKNIRWQPGNRPAPAPKTSTAVESALYVDQADIPAHADEAATPGGTDPGVGKVSVYVITMRGNFQGHGFRHPPGTPTPTGRYLDIVINARTFWVMAMSLRAEPTRMSSLGRPFDVTWTSANLP